MIERKILKVKTVGSRKAGSLQPDIELEHGMNLLVLEYNEIEKWCIVEVWGTDHELAEKIVTTENLERISKHSSVIETLPSHSQSPTIIGRFSIAREKAESVDAPAKRAQINGKTVPFIRIEKQHRTEDIILDEG
ncbi:MAG: hypothetical protein OEZ35_00095 [Candidatus Bathyarchaeota archaeon]|nr:hypothetical protein [Candidatus Bathyarchaeota archaeon]